MRYLPVICAAMALASPAIAGDLWTTPVCIIQFDDAYDSEYIKGFPIFEANGQQGVMYVRTDAIGTAGFMTVTQLKEMQTAGWDISNHTTDHTLLSTLEEADQRTKINDAYDWLVANGFGKTAWFLAYPGGDYNSTTIKVAKEFHIVGRRVSGVTIPHFRFGENGLDTAWVVQGRGISRDTGVNTVKANIDTAIDTDALIMLYLHGIVDANPDVYENLTSEVQEISDYLKTREDAGDISVVTLTEYYEAVKCHVQVNGVQLNGLSIE